VLGVVRKLRFCLSLGLALALQTKQRMNISNPEQIPNLTLNNRLVIPQVGLGVWQAAEGEEVEVAVRSALQSGYRLLDTAAIYGNEVGVGRAMKDSGVRREEIFLTTKLWNANHAYDDALRAFDESLRKLNCGYIDLYLIHWPLPMEGKFTQAWKALEKLYLDKRVRAIGVSNFKPHHLDELLLQAQVVPSVNQIELHPMLQQTEARAYCQEHGIAVESYSPLMRGGEVIENPLIVAMAQKHGKTPAQVVLRWHVQSGFIVIPKSVNPGRIAENIALFDFELSAEEMQSIEQLDAGRRLGADPDTADFK
jgi:diketogulonate reductase-like aldo/keto reductase